MKDLHLTRRGEIVFGTLQFLGTCAVLGVFVASGTTFLWMLIP